MLAFGTMDLTATPRWTGGDLMRFGKALVAGEDPPAEGPTYGDIVLWYTDLCAEVSAHIVMADWSTGPIDPLDVSSRPKTRVTITEKLSRMSTTLERVQDLAGIRVDSDFLLSEQEAFAAEVAAYFEDVGAADVRVKDIRQKPHSGYRAIHVYVTMACGRCEIQIRTRPQSAWANAYEALADVYGRQLRYGRPHPDSQVQAIVEQFHELSDWIAQNEARLEFCAWVKRNEDELRERGASAEKVAEVMQRTESLEDRLVKQNREYLATLAAAEGTLKAHASERE